MKLRYKGKERKFLYGRWYNPGDEIENSTIPNEDFEVIKKSKKEEI